MWIKMLQLMKRESQYLWFETDRFYKNEYCRRSFCMKKTGEVVVDKTLSEVEDFGIGRSNLSVRF